MKKYFFFALLFVTTLGCKSYVQVFKTDSSIKKDPDGFYIHENDSLKITYSFWKSKGLMTFSIYNKLDKPLYLDWKKSSYIDNAVKLDYWVEEEKSKGVSAYGSYLYNGPLLKPGYAISSLGGASISSTVKVERVTFIPPNSNYYRSQFFILPLSLFNLGKEAKLEDVPRNDNPKKKTKLFKASFTKINSPLIFRNFLTFSTSEDFKAEFYVDNEFYIQQILEMDRRHFERIRYEETNKVKKVIRDEKGLLVLFSDFESPDSFYLRIPKEGTIKSRKSEF